MNLFQKDDKYCVHKSLQVNLGTNDKNHFLIITKYINQIVSQSFNLLFSES